MKLVEAGRQGFMQFVGKQAVCPNCAAKVEFDQGDAERAKEWDDQREGRGWTLAWQCPTCGKAQSTTVYHRSNASSYWDER